MKFRMVDRITDFEPRKSIRGLKTVSYEEYQLKAGFGPDLMLPESLVMESLFQLGNWLIMLSSDFSKMGLLVRTNEVYFKKSVLPGQTLIMDVYVRGYRDDGVLFDGQGSINGEIIIHGTGCLAAFAPLAQFCEVDDLKMLFSDIFKPGNS